MGEHQYFVYTELYENYFEVLLFVWECWGGGDWFVVEGFCVDSGECYFFDREGLVLIVFGA